jgi:tetratricopeptide (TPR) repeat protein
MNKNSFLIIIVIFLNLCTDVLPIIQERVQLHEQAKSKLRSGEYLEARKLIKPLLNKGLKEIPEYIMAYFETFLARGEYADGLSELNLLYGDSSDNSYVFHFRGRFLSKMGEYKEAESAFIEANSLKKDFMLNQLYLGELFEITGRKERAFRKYAQIIDIYSQNRSRSVKTIGIAGKAYANIGDFHKANRVFKTAYDLDAQDVQILLWWGNLFREKFNTADARKTFEEALSVNSHNADLYIGYARCFESYSQIELLAKNALENNPKSIDAMNMLTEIEILDGHYDEAEKILQQTLKINPNHEQTLANLASIYHLRDESEKFELIESKIKRINTHCADFYTTLAENCILRFRYKDAVTFCHKAISKDWRKWEAHTLLGLNVLRTGETEEARRYLVRGFQGDPFNLYARNTLELIDDYKDFTEVESTNFVLLIHNSESDVLSAPILALAEECYDSLSIRYPYRPKQKIRIEAYHDNDDFAVRISGLPGIGLLGVCFGDVVAFDTPKAQVGREHNWSRTLWHELAHVMALGLSDHNVPRWFTEGLSVYEEKLARPEWARDMDLELYIAVEKDLLFSLKDINKGFTRPKFPEQIMLTYYQSAKLIEYIVTKYGFNAIIDMLYEFEAGNNLENICMNVLTTNPEELEKSFLNDLKIEMEKFAIAVSGLPPVFGEDEEDESFFEKLFRNSDNPFFNNIKEGNALLKKGDLEQAEGKFLKALQIFPNYTRAGNPYLGLASVYRQQKNQIKLIQILEKYLNVSEYGAYEARELAQIYADQGKIEQAQYYFNRSLQVEPYELETRSQLAAIYERRGQHILEAHERRAILALNPMDRAKAYYYLAQSLYNSGQKADAKQEVLRSLEIASGYRDAQKLLLKCLGN